MKSLNDKFGRKIDYLRLSLTSRCNSNCLYCSPLKASPAYEFTPDEILRLVRIFVDLGIKKVRITGGEPTVRTDLKEIVEKLNSLEKIEEIAMTTNGLNLTEDLARDLKKAGLDRVNIGLDSLNEKTYKDLSGGDNLKDALRGLEAALKADLSPIRINVVLIKGENENELDDFIKLARTEPLDVRFIELMPFAEGLGPLRGLSNKDILVKYPELKIDETDTSSSKGPCIYYKGDGFLGRVGFISPISHKFCSACNRVRLLSDGVLKPCLGQEEEIDLKPFFNDPEKLKAVIKEAVFEKPPAHTFGLKTPDGRSMRSIGG